MSKDSDPQTVTQRVNIPDFLRPLVQQQSAVGRTALSNLQNQLGGAGASDLVAPLNPAQQAAFGMAGDFATGRDGFLPASQNFLSDVLGGSGLSGFVDPAALSALRGTAQGQGIESFLPQATLDTLTRGATESAVPVEATDAAGSILNAELLPQASRDALTSTAEGDFLFGGQGFDAAVDAALRQAQPNILSTFGRAGRGTGGLAQTAISQAATDAFARQFGQERQNQLSAANTLANLDRAGRSQQLDAAGLLGNLGLSGQQQQLQSAGMLGDLASQERGRGLAAAGQLAGLSSQERASQFDAARLLPELGLIGPDVLSQIGGQQQAQTQQELMAPLLAQQQLLSAIGGGVPLGALLGSTEMQPTQSSPFLGGLGGALSGARLGSFVPGLGTGIGAGIGALGGILG